MSLAYRLAEFALGTDVLPVATREAALRSVFDLVTAAVAGFRTPGARAARTAARTAWGAGDATCWFSGQRLAVPGAAFANAAAASMLDLDDGHRAAIGHPGAPVISAVFATAEALPADAERILTAIALGYEVAIRIAAARRLAKPELDSFATGQWCGQAIAVAAGWLRRLPVATIAEAIAIAGTSAPNQAATAYTRIMGNHVKEGIAWATATGLTAVDLAHAGFTGPVDLLDHGERFDPRILADGLGASWLIESTYFKPYSCCRWIHGALDGLLQIQAEHGIPPRDIQAIDLHTFSATLALNNETAPRTLESAQYSAPFCLALAALHGGGALLPMQADSLHDPEARALAARVRLHLDPQYDAMFPQRVPSRVVVTSAAGTATRTVLSPRGEADNPMTWPDLTDKFDTVAAKCIDGAAQRSLRAAFTTFAEGNEKPLLAALGMSRPD